MGAFLVKIKLVKKFKFAYYITNVVLYYNISVH
jgi:hypothetical protein